MGRSHGLDMIVPRLRDDTAVEVPPPAIRGGIRRGARHDARSERQEDQDQTTDESAERSVCGGGGRDTHVMVPRGNELMGVMA